MRVFSHRPLLILLVFLSGPPSAQADEAYCQWHAENLSIEAPLCGYRGDPLRGQTLVIARDKGNCLACHAMPIPDEPFHGTIGPPLRGVGSRLTEAQLRLRVVDEQQVNPNTIMPGFYRDPKQLNRLLDEYLGKTLLTAQDVEDVVAYLVTLK